VQAGLRYVHWSPADATPAQGVAVYEHTPHGARFHIIDDGPANGDALVSTDAANRLLTIWGRRSLERPLTLDTDSISPDTVESVLWSAAQPWPAPGQTGRLPEDHRRPADGPDPQSRRPTCVAGRSSPDIAGGVGVVRRRTT